MNYLVKLFAKITLAHNQYKEGWKLLSHTPLFGGFKPKRLVELNLSTLAEAKDIGQDHAEYIEKNWRVLPDSWNDFYAIFPGTVWEDEKGEKMVTTLAADAEFGGIPHLSFVSYSLILEKVKNGNVSGVKIMI